LEVTYGLKSSIEVFPKGSMTIFLAALNSVAPHFRVKGHMLFLSQGHPFTRMQIDL